MPVFNTGDPVQKQSQTIVDKESPNYATLMKAAQLAIADGKKYTFPQTTEFGVAKTDVYSKDFGRLVVEVYVPAGTKIIDGKTIDEKAIREIHLWDKVNYDKYERLSDSEKQRFLVGKDTNPYFCATSDGFEVRPGDRFRSDMASQVSRKDITMEQYRQELASHIGTYKDLLVRVDSQLYGK